MNLEELEKFMDDKDAVQQVEDVISLYTDYEGNIDILTNINKNIDEKRILIPFRVRKNKKGEYNKFGLINKNGKIIVQPIYDFVVDDVLSEHQLTRIGLMSYSVYQQSKGMARMYLKYKYGVIDCTGKTIINIQHDEINLQECCERIIVRDNEYGTGLYDWSGKQIKTVGTFHKVFGFDKGLARVIDHRDKWGIIDINGNILLPTDYDHIDPFEGKIYNFAYVSVDNKKMSISLSDIKEGKYIRKSSDDDLPF